MGDHGDTDADADADATPAVEVRGLTKVYEGEVLAVDEIDFAIEEGDFCVVIGPSGCGKSTTLHSIVGTLAPTAGRVFIDGEDVTGVPTYERDIGLVFQDFQLFPHLTVEENVRYGLERLDRRDDAVVEETMELMHLTDSRDRSTADLSAGQRQRVALARSLVLRPKVLLLDEPLGDMDYKLQKRMERELLRVHREVDTTFVYVTHDQRQAMRMGDQLVVMNEGRIEQSAPAETVYNRPATAFVAAFVGDSNLFEGTLSSAGDDPAVETPVGTLAVDPAGLGADAADGDRVTALVRPHHLSLHADGAAADGAAADGGHARNEATGEVRDVIEQPGSGTHVFVTVPETSGGTREVQVRSWDLPPGLEAGASVRLTWERADTWPLTKRSVASFVDLERGILGE